MVGATHGTPEGFRADQASGSQQPPPPPPNLAKVMARQTELLNQLVQAQMGHFHQQSRGRDEPLSASYQDFSVPSLHYSIRQTSLWTLTLGFEPSSPSLPYYLLHVQMKTRRFLQPSNSTAQLVCGGIILTPCSLPIMLSPGMSFGLCFERIIYPRDSLSESSMNF
jgi:hypothetical protein